MPVTPTFPGLYIEEIQSSAHTITAAPTSIAVFVGYTHPFKTKRFRQPVRLFSFTDYEREFGGFFRSGAFEVERQNFGNLAQAINQFFLNGGSDAWVVGLRPGGFAATPGTASVGSITFTALEVTDNDYRMKVVVSNLTSTSSPPSSPPVGDTADITINYWPVDGGPGALTETYRQVSLDRGPQNKPNPDFIATRINGVSALARVTAPPLSPPAFFVDGSDNFTNTNFGATSVIFNHGDFTGVLAADTALDKLAVFNLLILPGVTNPVVLNTALAFCERKRAFFIMDPLIKDSADGSDSKFQDKVEDTVLGPAMPKGKNGALYFPYLKSPDPITGASIDPAVLDATNREFEMPPSGTVAGIFARTDADRGVWKAPAGLQAATVNTTGVVDRGRMTDARQGVLNPLGVNVLRDFPGAGTVVFGARTLVTETDEQWRYVPVRRMALFLEQTLYANLGWVVFEPNDEPLWAAIRNSIEAFMLGLFRQGAFQGKTPSQAFQVKCDSQTTTQADIDNGIVNIVVAFAPLKPAEFVIIKIAQLAGQTQTA